MIHEELTVTRTNTGYNHWVLAYQKIIDDYGLDKGKVASYVKGYLFNEPYTMQNEGLVNALVQASEGRIDRKEAKIKVAQIYSPP